MGDIIFHEERLISALKLTQKEYLDDHDNVSINNLIALSGFSKEVEDWIWEKKRKAFEVWSY